MTHDPGCVFCKIIRREIPGQILLETDSLVAFLDIHPVNPGHVLVVPKTHAPTLIELDPESSAEVGRLLPSLARAIRRVTRSDGLNVILNLGRVAGQTVDHVHWHLIPRFHDDDVHWPWPHQSYESGEADQLRAALSAELARRDDSGPPSE